MACSKYTYVDPEEADEIGRLPFKPLETFELSVDNREERKPLRIVCISDTHNNHDAVDVPDGDILIHAGDITKRLKSGVSYLKKFNNWLGWLPHETKIVVGGNHDLKLNSMGRKKSQKLLSNCIYLKDTCVTVHGVTIYGAPWHEHRGIKYASAFGKSRKNLRKKWPNIESDVDILVTHVPPYGILDRKDDNRRMGDIDLVYEILGRIRPRVHVFGHNHAEPGILELNTKHVDMESVKYFNRSPSNSKPFTTYFVNASQMLGTPKVFDLKFKRAKGKKK